MSVELLLTAWVCYVMKNESNHLGVWIHCQSVLEHFRLCNSDVNITDMALKQKMNKLSELNKFFLEKRCMIMQIMAM